MGFFNSLLIRITLAVIGGLVYAFITYWIVLSLGIHYEFAIGVSAFVYLFYLGSRLLLLFSGINSPYYSRAGKKSSNATIQDNPFYNKAQWVGKFYHQHDLILFVFLGILSILFLATLVLDGLSGSPFGNTVRNLWNTLLPPS